MLRELLSNLEPVHRTLLGLLKPSEIVSLVAASSLILTAHERRKYLDWKREAFQNTQWVEQLVNEGCMITVVGKDLATFANDMRTWHYNPEGIKILIVVTRLNASSEQHIEKLILDGIETCCDPNAISQTPRPVSPYLLLQDARIAVLLTTSNVRVDLDVLWTDRLLVTELNRSRNTDIISHYTWFTNMHENISLLTKSPLSHSTLSSAVGVLQRHGEANKILLSSGNEGWIYVATKNGVPLTVNEM